MHQFCLLRAIFVCTEVLELALLAFQKWVSDEKETIHEELSYSQSSSCGMRFGP